MKIVIFSTTDCGPCHELTAWLHKKGVPYTKKLVDENQPFMDEFLAVNGGYMGVPFSVVTDDAGKETKIVGFDRAAFEKVL